MTSPPSRSSPAWPVKQLRLCQTSKAKQSKAKGLLVPHGSWCLMVSLRPHFGGTAWHGEGKRGRFSAAPAGLSMEKNPKHKVLHCN